MYYLLPIISFIPFFKEIEIKNPRKTGVFVNQVFINTTKGPVRN